MTELLDAAALEAAHQAFRKERRKPCSAQFQCVKEAIRTYIRLAARRSAAEREGAEPPGCPTPGACSCTEGNIAATARRYTDLALSAKAAEARALAAEKARDEALAELTEALRERDEARETLEPFGEALIEYGDPIELEDDDSVLCAIRDGRLTITGVSVGDLRRAALIRARADAQPKDPTNAPPPHPR